MNAQPLMVLGDRRRSALTSRIATGARRWRQHWVPGADDVFEAECAPPAPGGFAAPVAALATSCWALEVSGERVAMLLLPHAVFAWSVCEAGGTSLELGGGCPADSLAESLEREVARTLFTETCLRDAQEVAGVASVAPADLTDWSRTQRAWTLTLSTPGCSRNCTLLVSAARLEMLAPARTPVHGDLLGARRDAVGENVIGLRAVVGETSLSMTELAQLAIDDVLVLDQRLTDAVTLLASAADAPVAAGSLGRSGVRRAIKIAGIPARN